MVPGPFSWTLLVITLLSASRVLAAIAFPFASSWGRVALVGWSALSDALDGHLARRTHTTTYFGAVLDVVADKALALSVLGWCWGQGLLELWQIALLLGREVGSATGSVLAALFAPSRSRQAVRPSPLGKATTALLFAFFLMLLVKPAWGLTRRLGVVTTLVSVLAGVDYLIRHLRAAGVGRASATKPSGCGDAGEADPHK